MTNERYFLPHEIVLAELQNKLRLRDFRRFSAGHMGVPLYTAQGDEGLHVVKFGENNKTGQEVAGNIRGYQQMMREGAAQIVPPGLKYGSIDSYPYLVMRHLGNSFVDKAKAGDFSVYENFLINIRRIVDDSIKEGIDHHLKGLEEVQMQLLSWYTRLAQAGILDVSSIDLVLDLDIQNIASHKSSLMLLDFTPDNVFFDMDRLKFIDPWKQTTYRGSIIPSIGQFATLTSKIYKLPGSDSFTESLGKACWELGNMLGLTRTQVASQFAMGEALQWALSSYVRITSEPDLSQKFADYGNITLRAINIYE